MVEVVVDDVVVEVDVDVEVGAAVVTGTVVVVAIGAVDVVLETATDDDVEAESVVASPSSLHATSIDTRMTKGTSRAVFTVASLARFVAIT